jgi:hypothetical protein
MKINEQKIREDLASFSVPAYNSEKMRETIHLAEKAYKERLLSKRIGFWEFISMQIRFIGRWVWLVQTVFLMIFLFLFSHYRIGTISMQSVFLLLSSFAPLIAFVGFPEIMKSYAHNMEEIEACTRFSMQKLMGARMLIIGLTDLFSLTLILAVSAAGNIALILRMILYLFVPFNVTCCICLTMLEHVRSRYAGYYCGAICVICIVLFCRFSLVKNYYEATATGTWIIFFCISIAYLAIEIVRVFQSFNRVGFRDEMLSIKW